MLAAEKSRSTFIAPIGIGLALFIAEMLGGEFATLAFCTRNDETDHFLSQSLSLEVLLTLLVHLVLLSSRGLSLATTGEFPILRVRTFSIDSLTDFSDSTFRRIGYTSLDRHLGPSSLQDSTDSSSEPFRALSIVVVSELIFILPLRFLEYETCLGPDCDGDGSCAISPPMQAPSGSLMGPNRSAPRMATGMSTDAGGFLGVPQSRCGSKMGGMMAMNHAGGMGMSTESVNRTLANNVERDQLDRIEIMLAQLVATGKIV